MESLSLTDARAQLPQLLDRVIAGESFTITRHGISIAVLTGHDEWMKTRAHDVIRRARALGAEREALRGKPMSDSIDNDIDIDVEARLVEIDWAKGGREPDGGRRP